MSILRQKRWLEWPTLALYFFTYFIYALTTIYAQFLPSVLVIILLAVLLTLHS